MDVGILALVIAVLLFLRVPVGLAILGPCVVWAMQQGLSVGYTVSTAFTGVNSFPLLAVPLFILVGVLANRLGIAERLFEFCLAALSRVRGNLAYVNLGTAVGFSWMSGSALADVAGLGKIQIPAMRRAGYPMGFASGLTASSSLIAPVMPPSIPAVIFASTAAVSTGALFAASVIPATLMATGLLIYIAIWTARRPEFTSVPFDARRFWRASVRVLGALATPVIILGGILTGVFTPTEAAATATVWMLILGAFYRTLRLKVLLHALKETLLITGGIMIILASAAALGLILARARISDTVADSLGALTDNPLVFLLLLNLLFIILGAVIDATAIILVTVPVLMPVAIQFGIDPIHFGVITIVNLMIGLLTPPVGSVLYVTSSVTREPVDVVIRGIAPFLIPLAAVLVLINLFPDVVMFLPRALGF
ncbi:TRAP transporter large permease [Agromyces mangrovi Wang et al. 2018]|uniref:TRAP transporter large permease n=1 Tax=Agromyces mangrovi TaxID=1858653 RepID=UPI0025725983|nr:TRAP transporter large permease [Agromyces mangrovi]BDZ65361.1 permease [Agromyces mangrovi]